MKRYTIPALVFVLTAVLLAGCRNQNNNQNATSEPTIMPTIEMPTMAPTVETTMPVTEATTLPTDSTDVSETETVGEDGIVGSDPSEGSAGLENRTRRVPRGR